MSYSNNNVGVEIARGIFNVIGTAIANNNNNSACNQGWRNACNLPYGYDRPVIYSPPIIQARVPKDCFGNGDYGSRMWHQGRKHKRDYENWPRQIPNWNNGNWGNGNWCSSVPSQIPSTWPNASNYQEPRIMITGNGQAVARASTSGRELNFDRASGVVTSFNTSTGQTKYFSGSNSFSPENRQKFLSGQPAEMPLGDNGDAVIYFTPSADRTRIERVEIKVKNQFGTEYAIVDNLSGGQGQDRGLIVPEVQQQNNYNQNQGNAA